MLVDQPAVLQSKSKMSLSHTACDRGPRLERLEFWVAVGQQRFLLGGACGRSEGRFGRPGPGPGSCPCALSVWVAMRGYIMRELL